MSEIMVGIDNQIRKATAAEVQRQQEFAAKQEALFASWDNLSTVKQSARTKLAALGLTDDEINALLGA